MSQVNTNQQATYTREVTLDKTDALNGTLEHCHRAPGIDSTNYSEYDPTSAAICAVEHSEDSPLLLERVPAIIAKLTPHKAHDKSFVAKVEKALEEGSSKDANEQLFEKKLFDGPNGKEFAYSLSPNINKDGLTYSRYLVHRAFNMAHIHADVGHINNIDIIKRCSKSGYPELLGLYISRFKEFCYDGKGCDYDTLCTLYVRSIYRKSFEDVANSRTYFSHLYDISHLDGPFRDALTESFKNLSVQAASILDQL